MHITRRGQTHGRTYTQSGYTRWGYQGGDTPKGDTCEGDTYGGDTYGGDTHNMVTRRQGGDAHYMEGTDTRRDMHMESHTHGGDTHGGDTHGGDTRGDTHGGTYTWRDIHMKRIHAYTRKAYCGGVDVTTTRSRSRPARPRAMS